MRKSIHVTVILCIFLVFIFSSIPNSAHAQVNIPDRNLKMAIERALGVTDPTAADMLGLTSLTATNWLIANFTGLEYATNLTYLALSGNPVSDITPLSGLTNLTELYLSSYQLSNITALSGLTSLTTLYLGYSNVSDITALSGLTNLTTLYLYNDQINNITALSDLTNLTTLYLNNNFQLIDISALSGLTNLTTLDLMYTSVIDITPLSGLTNLTDFSISSHQLSDITALSGLTNLTTLYLWNVAVSDITALSGLTNLTDLHLEFNSLSDITALSGLTNLTDLHLESYGLRDITALSGLTNLTTLDLNHSKVSDISPLSTLTHLEFLNISYNPLNAAAYCIYIPVIQTNNPSINILYDPMNDTCDFTDTDGDGVHDDGDGSGIAGDNTCIGGSTINCDDNCVNMPNADQADVDVDGIGDVCDAENYHPYDTNQDWIIGDFELLDAIDCWADPFCDLDDFDLLDLIDFWAAGCYRLDPATNTHKAGCPEITIDVASYANFNGGWDYQWTENAVVDTWAVEVSGTTTKNGESVYLLQEYDPNGYPNDQDFYLTDMSQGLYRAGGIDDYQKTSEEEWFLEPPMPVLLATFIPGREYTYDHTETSMGSGTWIVKVDATSVIVPAGNYNDCYKSTVTRKYGTIQGSATRWYCKNIGLVKKVSEDPFTGPSTLALTLYTP